MEYKKLEDIIVEMGMYEEIKLEAPIIQDGNMCTLTDDCKTLFRLLFHTHKVNLKCIECNKDEYPFTVEYNVCEMDKSEKCKNESIYCCGRYLSIDSNDILQYKFLLYKKLDYIVDYLFKCPMDDNHYYTMTLLIKFSESLISVRKVGQIPLNIDLRINIFSNFYKKQLNSYKAFEDYRSFEQASSRGLKAGACTYLRRVLEKMINEKVKDDSVDQEKAKKVKKYTDKKLELCKHLFDPEIKDSLKPAYELLSRGIHELTESEIDGFFSLLQGFINLELDYEKENEDRTDRRKKICSSINQHNSKY